MIPTSTGAAKALGLVIPELKGKLDGSSIRVPTPNVSVVDLTWVPGRTLTAAEINEALKAAAASGPLKGILAVTDEPLVSIDFNLAPASSTAALAQTQVIDGGLGRVLSWYDNEWGFSEPHARHRAWRWLEPETPRSERDMAFKPPWNRRRTCSGQRVFIRVRLQRAARCRPAAGHRRHPHPRQRSRASVTKLAPGRREGHACLAPRSTRPRASSLPSMSLARHRSRPVAQACSVNCSTFEVPDCVGKDAARKAVATLKHRAGVLMLENVPCQRPGEKANSIASLGTAPWPRTVRSST